MLIVTIPICAYISTIVHLNLIKEFTNISDIEIQTVIQSIVGSEKHLQLYVLLQFLFMLFIVLILFVETTNIFESKLGNVTDKIKTPFVVGQGQHGTARWLKNNEYEKVFDKNILEEKEAAGTINAVEAIQLLELRANLAEEEAELELRKQELDNLKDQLDTYNDTLSDLNEQEQDAYVQIAEGRQEIVNARQEIADGRAELEKNKIDLVNGRKELEDAQAELNEQLSQLRKGTIVTVVYYCIYEQEYHQLTGAVAKVDPYWGLLQVGHMSIDFSEIDRIEHLQEPV